MIATGAEQQYCHHEKTPVSTRLEFYLPGGRHLTLLKRDGWLGLTREVSPSGNR